MEAEREKFRTYLENHGVMSALTNAFVNLYESQNKPEDALAYISKALDVKSINASKIEALEKKVSIFKFFNELKFLKFSFIFSAKILRMK